MVSGISSSGYDMVGLTISSSLHPLVPRELYAQIPNVEAADRLRSHSIRTCLSRPEKGCRREPSARACGFRASSPGTPDLKAESPVAVISLSYGHLKVID